ncbi:tRNA (adenosine(37)-N6)-threonylcarbamoyltransferase complex dimerization subunit type 1 TsaB [Novipirellula artificiosorum]|uniref:tRNA threonylcarbamoyladenosine biosynthesis protein TsaB n=1 Tax=Novipirellula artificiosorum TaxID=2528016 RepID=A0A5C6DM64_9BACT|nr:tRNA (adenosine(37)-N6)-threonylcarbamoyltransferase complex dimerization subunit type 1 TsaB [Novipirellula artificiosorum]TWU35949.1 tRNA threonylcarbamoyladenosine biosynthesis protein TsaB [Novipirellula artificiosorum]
MVGITQLAIETTGRSGSLAILVDQDIVYQHDLGAKSRTAAAIGPALKDAIDWCRRESDGVDFISVADGPGSFTGLRIGVTLAKMLSYSLQVPLVSVDSLAAIAATIFSGACPSLDSAGQQSTVSENSVLENLGPEVILVATDAYRGQFFTGSFRRLDTLPDLDRLSDRWSAHPKCVKIVGAADWAVDLRQVDLTRVALAGEAKPFGNLAQRRVAASQPDAVGVGLLGVRAARLQKWVDPAQLVPRYLRGSAAEEKAASKLNGQESKGKN